jgi:hypothetical protein
MTYSAQPKYKPVDSARLKYLLDVEIAKVDFTMRMPDKRMEKLRLPMALRGFTYLGFDYMAINDNLQPDEDYKTQCHEAGHTEWEYGTRRNTEWKCDIDKDKIRKIIYENYNYN